MHKDCPICRSEGFTAHNRPLLRAGERHVITTLYQISTDLVAHDEAALSESAWNRLDLNDGDTITVSHPDPLESLSHVRSRIYGNSLSEDALGAIITDVVDGKYSDIHLSSFITACAASARPWRGSRAHQGYGSCRRSAVVECGYCARQAFRGWPAWESNHANHRADHCRARTNDAQDVLPSYYFSSGHGRYDNGARRIDDYRHSSRGRTRGRMYRLGRCNKAQPSTRHPHPDRAGAQSRFRGAADRICTFEKDCRGLDASHPRYSRGAYREGSEPEAADALSVGLIAAADAFGIKAKVIAGDGTQPIGRGIGPTLEANDVLAVLQCAPTAPHDIRDRAVALAGALIEFGVPGAAWSRRSNRC